METVRYCRLVFGSEVANDMWLHVGLDSIVVERPGHCERRPFCAAPDDPAWREAGLGNIGESNGTTCYRDLRAYSAAGVFALSLRGEGWGLLDCCYAVDNLPLSATREQAPVVHFGGPLTIRTSLERRGCAVALVAQVGTAGIGEGVFACLSASIAHEVPARPVAELQFPKKGGGSHRVLLELGFDC
jgi:hypothetical protein